MCKQNSLEGGWGGKLSINMYNILYLLNKLNNYNYEYRSLKYEYKIRNKNKIYNKLFIRNKRIFTTFIDLGFNTYFNIPNLYIKKRNVFNMYFDAFLMKRYIYTPFTIKYYKDRSRLILEQIKSYKFYRIVSKLPVNGQNTHSNHRTVRRLLEISQIKDISPKVFKIQITQKKKKTRRRGRGRR